MYMYAVLDFQKKTWGQLALICRYCKSVQRIPSHCIIPFVVVFIGSNSSVESDHASSSAKSAPVQDNILNEQTDGPKMKTQMNYAPSSKNYFELTGIDENGTSLRAD